MTAAIHLVDAQDIEAVVHCNYPGWRAPSSSSSSMPRSSWSTRCARWSEGKLDYVTVWLEIAFGSVILLSGV